MALDTCCWSFYKQNSEPPYFPMRLCCDFSSTTTPSIPEVTWSLGRWSLQVDLALPKDSSSHTLAHRVCNSNSGASRDWIPLLVTENIRPSVIALEEKVPNLMGSQAVPSWVWPGPVSPQDVAILLLSKGEPLHLSSAPAPLRRLPSRDRRLLLVQDVASSVPFC